jgi:hypothetical protein
VTRFERLLRADPSTLTELQRGWRDSIMRQIDKEGMTLDEFCVGLSEDTEHEVVRLVQRMDFQDRISRPTGRA